ncbi:MAG: hypothetical protein NXI21_01210 [Alphaproteobacteria bacterium]|nr:hypothetical protein [Alphaproteobacteria bacterium]
MNHKHRKVLHALFAHPFNDNIDFGQVQNVLRELGAEIEERHGSKIAVTLNGKTAAFKHARHGVPREEVMQLRHFLTDCGVDPTRDYPL